MGEWIENKGRKRAPFAKGTLIDIVYRDTSGYVFESAGPALAGKTVRVSDGEHEAHGVACGSEYANDWEISNVNGDILRYRLTPVNSGE